MIRIDSVTKYYGKLKALDDVSILIRKGECIGLLGSNGSGKSTLYRCILGIHSYEGLIRVNNADPNCDGKTVRSQIGYMPQAPSLHSDLTVSQTLQFYTDLRGGALSNAYEMLERVELDHTRTMKVGELSGGMKQRLSFVVAMIGAPPILLLDEPTVSIDKRSQRTLITWLYELKEAGLTMVFSTHQQHELTALVDRTITLENGAVVSQSEITADGIITVSTIIEGGSL